MKSVMGESREEERTVRLTKEGEIGRVQVTRGENRENVSDMEGQFRK